MKIKDCITEHLLVYTVGIQSLYMTYVPFRIRTEPVLSVTNRFPNYYICYNLRNYNISSYLHTPATVSS